MDAAASAGAHDGAFIADDSTPLLVHPLGTLEVKQFRCRSTRARSHRLGEAAASRVTLDADGARRCCERRPQAVDQFSPGHFQQLDEEQLAAGVRDHASGNARGRHRRAREPATSVAYEWERFFRTRKRPAASGTRRFLADE